MASREYAYSFNLRLLIRLRIEKIAKAAGCRFHWLRPLLFIGLLAQHRWASESQKRQDAASTIRLLADRVLL